MGVWMVSGSVWMVSECVRQMSGVGRFHMQCQKHAETAGLNENDTQKHKKGQKTQKRCFDEMSHPKQV